jgi:1,2-dihydroxy-3-keto-5-methylthiopentene dioxygenase
MTTLHIRPDHAPDQLLFESRDHAEISRALAARGIRFERWPSRGRLGAEPSAEAVLTAFAPEIARLKSEGGYVTADVVRVSPDHPERAALRQKFLAEHRHSEDEVRFFVAGAGLFSLHVDHEVLELLCEAGDLLSVPAGTPHWFDMGDAPSFVAIRLFQTEAGWAAQFTGSAIAQGFTRFPGSTRGAHGA